ncbi:MAG TPA: MBL fold metallo-hydrolase, partial [Solirubrobacterales bacterium]|nr:MBL fold metallo-hydrolase [Solirubrobacterales bacterium]
MELRRLAWAGLEVRAEDRTAVIDFVDDFAGLHGSGEPPREEIPAPPSPGSVGLALLTHMHRDHADVAALELALGDGAQVLRPAAASGSGEATAFVAGTEAALAASGLATKVLGPWETIEVGPFEISALPAVDGFGDPQVSWVLAAEGRRVLHAGDTLFHGWWWLAASRCGPIDVAFLPAGGAIVDLAPRQPPSPLPAGMGPAEAAAAGKLLGADLVVPIHYGPLHETPNYVQADDPAGSLEVAARELGVSARALRPGESL